jgi:hypothetical protein
MREKNVFEIFAYSLHKPVFQKLTFLFLFFILVFSVETRLSCPLSTFKQIISNILQNKLTQLFLKLQNKRNALFLKS